MSCQRQKLRRVFAGPAGILVSLARDFLRHVLPLYCYPKHGRAARLPGPAGRTAGHPCGSSSSRPYRGCRVGRRPGTASRGSSSAVRPTASESESPRRTIAPVPGPPFLHALRCRSWPAAPLLLSTRHKRLRIAWGQLRCSGPRLYYRVNGEALGNRRSPVRATVPSDVHRNHYDR